MSSERPYVRQGLPEIPDTDVGVVMFQTSMCLPIFGVTPLKILGFILVSVGLKER